MKTYLDCIPCFFKQALEASRLAGAAVQKQKKILDKLCPAVAKFPLSLPPPYMGRIIYKIVVKETGNKDPFYSVKQKSNRLALKLYPQLKRKIHHCRDRLFTAVELAIAGNIIDFGVRNSHRLQQELEEFLRGNFDIDSQHRRTIFSYRKFKRDLAGAETILFLADNAGEVVFDRLLIEEIKAVWPQKKIFYAVRKGPIINDALKEDASFCGIDKIATVVSSGSDAPGTFFEFATRRFRKIYQQADLIISKGQGNFESLSDQKGPLYFLFRAKCPVAAKDIGCELGEIVLKGRD